MQYVIPVAKNTINILLNFFLRDPASGNQPVTGIAYNDSDLVIAALDTDFADVSLLSPVTMTAGSWVENGWVEVNSTDAPGYYQFAFPPNRTTTYRFNYLVIFDALGYRFEPIEFIVPIVESSASGIAAAVWNASRASYVSANTFGQGVASVQGNVTGNVAGSVASVSGNVGGIASGGITPSSFQANSINASALATDAVTEIVSAVWAHSLADIWNKAFSGYTGSTGTFGYLMSNYLNSSVSSRATPADVNAQVQAVVVANKLDELAVSAFSSPAAGSLLDQITEDDPFNPGVRRFTEDSLAQAPTGAGGGGAGDLGIDAKSFIYISGDDLKLAIFITEGGLTTASQISNIKLKDKSGSTLLTVAGPLTSDSEDKVAVTLTGMTDSVNRRQPYYVTFDLSTAYLPNGSMVIPTLYL
jgi:hypothetical protein